MPYSLHLGDAYVGCFFLNFEAAFFCKVPHRDSPKSHQQPVAVPRFLINQSANFHRVLRKKNLNKSHESKVDWSLM